MLHFYMKILYFCTNILYLYIKLDCLDRSPPRHDYVGASRLKCTLDLVMCILIWLWRDAQGHWRSSRRVYVVLFLSFLIYRFVSVVLVSVVLDLSFLICRPISVVWYLPFCICRFMSAFQRKEGKEGWGGNQGRRGECLYLKSNSPNLKAGEQHNVGGLCAPTIGWRPAAPRTAIVFFPQTATTRDPCASCTNIVRP